jgi:3-hydroxyacyl-CoA dehydrogenase/enoyl-CoA hydratase/3-hydroxybutyryl-CoA epimerase
MKFWQQEKDADGIVWLTLDRPGTSTNTLSEAVLRELDVLLGPLASAVPAGLVLRSGKPNGFVAGADVREFTALTSESLAYERVRRAQRVLDRIAELPCPSVALIRGFALGGGLELALACRYRIAVGDANLSLGFPEVQLGIHPGFGGTVRAVDLLGVTAAMDLMLTGRPVRADKALRLGLVDRYAAAEELESAARTLIRSPPARHRAPLAARLLSLPLVRSFIKPRILAQLARRARRDQYPAPFALVDLWAAHGGRGAAAYDAEARSIAHLFQTDTSRNLVRVFLLQERLKALGGRSTAALQRVHVIGAGVMGGDIAAWCALRGLEVTLQDRELKFIEPALRRAGELFGKRLRDPSGAAAARQRLRADVPGDGVATADVVIEAIYENLEAKRALYATLEPRMKAGAILATNTSSIMLEPLAAQLRDPGRLVGLHFFNPVAQMPLVEIIRTAATGDEVLHAAFGFTRRIDKLPLPCRSAPGFVVNRVLIPYQQEAMIAAEEGLPLELIDAVATGFGMPMGPIELADVVGLDVCAHVGEIISAELARAPAALPMLQSRVAAGKLGRKSGEGFYLWHEGKPVKRRGPLGAPPGDLEDRMVLALLNEAVACLREGVVESADLLDAAVVFGTGFAPFRGGPLHYARRRGPDALVARLEELAARHGSRFAPDSGWSDFERIARAPDSVGSAAPAASEAP